MDPVKVKEQIAELKKKLADDRARSKRGAIPGWLKDRQVKRETTLKKLEAMIA